MKRVLIVDDNVDAGDTLAMLIQTAGHEVRTAVSGTEALGLVATFQPDVVLLDLRLPDMDGHSIARELRARPESAHCILAAVTGFDRPEDRRKSQEAGFDFHLVKPVGLKDLKPLLGS
jgi:two-component system CheB/CheR fusion protein